MLPLPPVELTAALIFNVVTAMEFVIVIEVLSEATAVTLPYKCRSTR